MAGFDDFFKGIKDPIKAIEGAAKYIQNEVSKAAANPVDTLQKAAGLFIPPTPAQLVGIGEKNSIVGKVGAVVGTAAQAANVPQLGQLAKDVVKVDTAITGSVNRNPISTLKVVGGTYQVITGLGAAQGIKNITQGVGEIMADAFQVMPPQPHVTPHAATAVPRPVVTVAPKGWTLLQRIRGILRKLRDLFTNEGG
jgi:hypothetical protein